MINNVAVETTLARKLRQHGRAIAAIKDEIEAQAFTVRGADDEEITPKEHAFYALRDTLDNALDKIDSVYDVLNDEADLTDEVDDRCEGL